MKFLISAILFSPFLFSFIPLNVVKTPALISQKSDAAKVIRHTVAFRLKNISAAESEAFFRELNDLKKIPGVKKFSVHAQVGKKNNFTHGVFMDFKSQEAYTAYNNHPQHVAFVKNYWEKYVEDFIELDYDF